MPALQAAGGSAVVTAIDPASKATSRRERTMKRFHTRVCVALSKRGWRSRIDAIATLETAHVLDAGSVYDRWPVGHRLTQLLPYAVALCTLCWRRGAPSEAEAIAGWEWFHTVELHHELLLHHGALLADTAAERPTTVAAVPSGLAHILEAELQARGWKCQR